MTANVECVFAEEMVPDCFLRLPVVEDALGDAAISTACLRERERTYFFEREPEEEVAVIGAEFELGANVVALRHFGRAHRVPAHAAAPTLSGEATRERENALGLSAFGGMQRFNRVRAVVEDQHAVHRRDLDAGERQRGEIERFPFAFCVECRFR